MHRGFKRSMHPDAVFRKWRRTHCQKVPATLWRLQPRARWANHMFPFGSWHCFDSNCALPASRISLFTTPETPRQLQTSAVLSHMLDACISMHKDHGQPLLFLTIWVGTCETISLAIFPFFFIHPIQTNKPKHKTNFLVLPNTIVERHFTLRIQTSGRSI